jgi:dTDP-4-amino-4,6-dideoxygalactose transaminase
MQLKVGATYKGKKTGAFGKFAAFSFNGNKVITTGGGGMIISDDIELAKLAKHITTTAKIPHKWEYKHDMIGYNYRMSNISAGIGRGQMEVLEQRIQKRRENYHYYRDQLVTRNAQHVTFQEEPSNKFYSNHWLTAITINPDLTGGITKEHLRLELAARNIESRPLWKPMHMQPFFSEYDYIGGDVSEKLFENGVCLPSDTKMTDEDLERIVGIIKGLWV